MKQGTPYAASAAGNNDGIQYDVGTAEGDGLNSGPPPSSVPSATQLLPCSSAGLEAPERRHDAAAPAPSEAAAACSVSLRPSDDAPREVPSALKGAAALFPPTPGRNCSRSSTVTAEPGGPPPAGQWSGGHLYAGQPGSLLPAGQLGNLPPTGQSSNPPHAPLDRHLSQRSDLTAAFSLHCSSQSDDGEAGGGFGIDDDDPDLPSRHRLGDASHAMITHLFTVDLHSGHGGKSQAEHLMQDLTELRLLGCGGCGTVYKVGG